MKLYFIITIIVLLGAFLIFMLLHSASKPSFHLVWADEFNGQAGSSLDKGKWLYDIGTCYPGCPTLNWGTGEVETMTDSTDNVYQDGQGHLVIKPLLKDGKWTSGRVETQLSNFEAPQKGILAIEASIKQPDVSGEEAKGYWPAFWALGASFRGVYTNWPQIGEMDIMENVNGMDSVFGTFHCGTLPSGPCRETNGIGSGQHPCPNCKTDFHTYRVEYDKSTSPEEIRWYLDGKNYFTIKSSQVDDTTWKNATDHGFFIIFDLAIGGGFPGGYGGGPTTQTSSGGAMLIDYVRVYTKTY